MRVVEELFWLKEVLWSIQLTAIAEIQQPWVIISCARLVISWKGLFLRENQSKNNFESSVKTLLHKYNKVVAPEFVQKMPIKIQSLFRATFQWSTSSYSSSIVLAVCWLKRATEALQQVSQEVSLCTAARSPKKKIGEERLWFTVDNCAQYHVIFPGMCGKWYDWYHWNNEFWLAFIFISLHQHRENHRELFYDEFVCTLRTVKNTNKNLFDGQRGFSFKVGAELLSMECKVGIDSAYICRNCCQR